MILTLICTFSLKSPKLGKVATEPMPTGLPVQIIKTIKRNTFLNDHFLDI